MVTDKANQYYEKGIKLYTQNKIEQALIEFNKAFEINPNNTDFKTMKKLAEYKLNDPYIFYKNGLQELSKENYDKAKDYFELALNIKDDDLFKEALQVALNHKIDIMKCSKNILLTLNCLDAIKVDNILKSRNAGKIWYDIDSFVEAYQIQPHELIDLQDKIAFPPKPKSTVSRKIEF